ncbi:MAG: 30S ribosomal protein S5 [Phycisphaerae bacterium]
MATNPEETQPQAPQEAAQHEPRRGGGGDGRGPRRGGPGGGGGRGGPGGGRGGPGGPGGPGGRGGRRRDRDGGDDGGIEDTLVKLYRCATVVKGGRRFSFGALVVVGDRNGRVGFGYGKANEVPQAVEKGVKIAKRNLVTIPRRGTTVPHRIIGRFGASKILLIPAAPGTGVIAGAAARAVLELAGIKDVLTKASGSTSPKNLVKAAVDGLTRLRTRRDVERLRGVKIELALGAALAEPAAATA